MLRQLELADKYIMAAPADLVGILAVNKDGVPIEVADRKRDNAILRKATEEPEVMPSPAEFNAVGWSSEPPVNGGLRQKPFTIVIRVVKAALVAAIALFCKSRRVWKLDRLQHQFRFRAACHVHGHDLSVLHDQVSRDQRSCAASRGLRPPSSRRKWSRRFCAGSAQSCLRFKFAPMQVRSIEQRHLPSRDLPSGSCLWQVGFMSIGGEWFGMWQSQQWNGVPSAFRFLMTIMQFSSSSRCRIITPARESQRAMPSVVSSIAERRLDWFAAILVAHPALSSDSAQHLLDVRHWRLRQDFVPEIEDKPPASEVGDDIVNGTIQRCAASEQRHRIQVSLNRHTRRNPFPDERGVGHPVQAHRIDGNAIDIVHQ